MNNPENKSLLWRKILRHGGEDVLNLTRMNWNTADIRGKWPVSLSLARRVGGILDQYGDDDLVETSFRYFM